MIEAFLEMTCDGCGDTISDTDPDKSRGSMRLEWRAFGWKSVGKLDYCPNCVENGAAKDRVDDFSR